MAFLFGFMSVALMASVPVMNKLVVISMSPFAGALANSLISTSFFALVNFSKPAPSVERRDFYSMIAGVFNAIGLLCLYLALREVHPAVVGFINRSGIVFAMLLSFVFMNLRPTKMEVGLGAVALLGALGASGVGNIDAKSHALALAFTSTIGFTCSQYFLKMATQKHANVSILLRMNFWTMLVLLICFLFSSEVTLLPSTANAWAIMALASLVGSCLGFWFYLISLKTLSFSMATILRATGPLFTALISMPFFAFNLSVSQIVSGVVLIVAIIAMALRGRRPRATGG